MKNLYGLLLIICSTSTGLLSAQTLYLNAIFGVNPPLEVPYGSNASVLFFPAIVKQTLVMDVYTPAGDTTTKRPVVLVLHTGNFLPFQSPIDGSPGYNGLCGGTIKDSVVVECCKRLASMGYVACAVDYRLGLNPPNAFVNAAYRGLQDLRSCIRYLRKSVAEDGNPFGIDPDKIDVWGIGTGAYLAFSANYLDNYIKIPTASNGKFMYDHDNNPNTPPIPMIILQINGDIYGTSVGIDPMSGDTLSYINTPGYSSDFHLAVNLGGACFDSAWVDPGQNPIISYQVPQDNVDTYGNGIVGFPDMKLMNLQGSYIIQHMSEDYGNNDAFINAPAISFAAEQAAAFANSPVNYTDPTEALYPFNIAIVSPGPPPAPSTIAPWDWTSFTGNGCNTDKSKAIPYIDTIIQFYAPRACFALGLTVCINKILSEKEPIAKNIPMQVLPNPASEAITFTAGAEHIIRSVQVFNNLGRMIRNVQNVNQSTYTLLRNNLTAGSYVVKVSFKEGFVSKVVVFE